MSAQNPASSSASPETDLVSKLNGLVYTLTLALNDLKSAKTKAALDAALHDHQKLPEKDVFALSRQAIDVLHETEQLLQPGPLVLADHFLGFMDSKCLVAAVELDVADVLKEKPLGLTQLAEKCAAHPHYLGQILRVLYNKGIFSFDSASGLYSNNHTSEMLCKDHWTQWRNWVDLYGNEFYEMAKGIPKQVKASSTRIAGQHQFDTDGSLFDYFVQQGLLKRLQNTLSGGAIAQAPGILADYPWNEISDAMVFDVGGGQGGFLATVLRHCPKMKGGILDTAPVIERAKNAFHTKEGPYADVGDRVPADHLIGGDFFVSIPAYEVYVMKWVLHDWHEEKAITILKNIRKSIVRGPLSRLVIFEALLADGRSSRLSRYADITMMISADGLERDRPEWEALAEKSGWKVSRVFHLRNAWPCAIEFIPVWDDANGSAGEEQVTSEMSFLEPWDASKGEPFYRSAAEEGLPTTNFKFEPHNVTVTNARPFKDRFTIEKNGFQYVDDPDGVPEELLATLRQNDKEQTAKAYYSRVEQLVKKHTGASRVLIFDNTVRKRDPGLDKHENPNGREQPATTVHCDQSGKGAKGRLAQNLPEGESVDEILSKGRVLLINVWRPLVGPVVDWPLATMDFTTLEAANIHPVSLYRGTYTDRGQTMTFDYNAAQRWYYLKHHRVDEVTFIKIWDSKGAPGTDVAECCPHAAFKHPETPEDARPRESIEVRCLAIFDG